MFLNTIIPNPVAFSVFGFPIMWYGIFIGIGILLGAVLIYRRAPKYGINPERILDMLIICIPAGIIGARVYYVLFNPALYDGDFLKMINIRLGGLAIHGGLLFGLAAAFFLCGRYRIRPLALLDLVAPSLALAQSIGRWGNYFNSEAHGGPTGLPWAIPVGGQMVHPTFLYESLWCLMLFGLLLALSQKSKFEGQIILLYGMLYSLERFFVEWLRTDSLMIGSFKQAQVFSAFVLLICFCMYIILWKKNRQKNRIWSL